MTDDSMNDDDVYAERLRDVLNGEGSSMSIGDDGLGKIMDSAHGDGGGRRRPAWLAPLAVAAAAVLLLGGVAIGVNLSNSSDDNTATVGTSSSPGISTGQSPTPTHSASGASSVSSSDTAPSGDTSTVPSPNLATLAVYYVADVPSVGTRLYREFHSLDVVAGDPKGQPRAALAELFGGNATDPDYTSLWPSGTQLRGLTVKGDLATVDVTDFPTGDIAAQQMAVQQIVWTVTATDPVVKRVQMTVNGKAPKGAASLGQPTKRANALDTLANVWILAPTEGATVTSPVKVTVYGTGFEGNIPVKVFKSDGTTLVAETALTTQMGAFAAASTTIKLPSGSYVIKAYNDNGKDGTLQLWDTKSFTVG